MLLILDDGRLKLGLGDMAIFSIDINNYHDKYFQISFKFKGRFLLQSVSCRNQTWNVSNVHVFEFFTFP